MAGSLRSRETKQMSQTTVIKRNFSASEAPGTVGGSTPLQTEPWEMRLSLSQAVIFMSVICGTMTMVFLFGLYAGREQGVNTALEGHSGEAVRLPVANPVVVSENPARLPSDGLVAESERNADSLAAHAGNRAEDAIQANVVPPTTTGAAELSANAARGKREELTPKSEQKIDFSPASKESASVAGLESESAKAVAPVVADTAPKNAEPVAKSAKDKDKTKTKIADDAKPEQVKTVRSSAIVPGWYLQIAATRTSSDANAMLKKLQSKGLKPTLEAAEINNAVYYRIIIGPYPTKEATASARKAAIAAKAAKGEPFLKLVK